MITGATNRPSPVSSISKNFVSSMVAIMIALDPDFDDLLTELDRANARYLIVGGYAVAAHGYIRTTKYLDIWIDIAEDNVGLVYSALSAFGWPGIQQRDIGDPDTVLFLGVPPVCIELLKSISGVTFATCYPRRIYLSLGQRSVPCIGLSDLRRNKQASGRPKDREDLRRLPVPSSSSE